MSFFKTIWNAIANFFSGLSRELQKIWIPTAVAVGNTLKTFLNLDSGDIIGEVATAFGVHSGTELEDKIKQALNNVVPKLELAQQFLALGNVNAILAAVLKSIADKTTDQKTLFWTNFVALINHDFADGKLTLLESWQAVAWFYKNQPQPTPETIAADVVELKAQAQADGSVLYVPENTIAALSNIQQNTDAVPTLTIENNDPVATEDTDDAAPQYYQMT